MPSEWRVRTLGGTEVEMERELNALDLAGYDIYTILPAPEKMGKAMLVVVAKKNR